MPTESNEVQIARVDEKLKAILAELAQARDGRKQQYEKLEQITRYQQSLESRIKNLEEDLAKASPTIDEFLVIKHKVQGAGMFGKWIWGAAGAMLTMVAAIKTPIIDWLTK